MDIIMDACSIAVEIQYVFLACFSSVMHVWHL